MSATLVFSAINMVIYGAEHAAAGYVKPFHDADRAAVAAWEARRGAAAGAAAAGSHGRDRHAPPPLPVIDCRSFGIYAVVLLSLLSFPAKMTASPRRDQQPAALRRRSSSSPASRSRRSARGRRGPVGLAMGAVLPFRRAPLCYHIM